MSDSTNRWPRARIRALAVGCVLGVAIAMALSYLLERLGIRHPLVHGAARLVALLVALLYVDAQRPFVNAQRQEPKDK